MLSDDLTFCERRELWLRPARDCKHCHWYECTQHPRHIMWPDVQRILSECNTMRRSRPDCKGKKKLWDGEQKHCMRFNKYQGSKYDEHPCVNCSLDRPCQHRGEHGQWLLDWAKKNRSDSMRYITRVDNRFKVRMQCNGKQVTIGTYGTVEEAKAARDCALLMQRDKIADTV